jgi:hypothetical protein
MEFLTWTGGYDGPGTHHPGRRRCAVRHGRGALGPAGLSHGMARCLAECVGRGSASGSQPKPLNPVDERVHHWSNQHSGENGAEANVAAETPAYEDAEGVQ